MRLRILANILLHILVLVLLLDPSNTILKLKVILFVLFFAVWILSRLIDGITITKDLLIVIGLSLIIPVFSLLLGIAQNNPVNMSVALGYLKAFMFMFLLWPVVDMQFDILTSIRRSSVVLACIIVAISVVFYGLHQYESVLYNYFVLETDTVKIASRNLFGIDFQMIFYNSSPILVFPFAYYLNRLFKNGITFSAMFCTCLFAGTLFVSGTRANILSVIFITILFFLVSIYTRVNKMLSAFLLISFSTIGLTLANMYEIEQGSVSSRIKEGHFTSYTDHFLKNPQYLLIGEGIGTSFYTTGFAKEVYMTELTYVELVRVLGIPLFIVFAGLIFLPFAKILRPGGISLDDFEFYLPYLAYLFIAGTNPLLISSTGFLVVVAAYSKLFQPTFRTTLPTNTISSLI